MGLSLKDPKSLNCQWQEWGLRLRSWWQLATFRSILATCSICLFVSIWTLCLFLWWKEMWLQRIFKNHQPVRVLRAILHRGQNPNATSSLPWEQIDSERAGPSFLFRCHVYLWRLCSLLQTVSREWIPNAQSLAKLLRWSFAGQGEIFVPVFGCLVHYSLNGI